MPTIRLEIDEETAERLDTERELLGFEDATEYLRWIVDNRAAIEAGTERGELLSAYAERVEELERQVEGEDPADCDGTCGAAAGGTSGGDDAGSGGDPPSASRVERITDERLDHDASELQGVEAERLDELARRAVAETRERLGREPGTGLDYRSKTSLDDDVPPGSDLVDLESIEVPGYDDELVERRRRAVGAAVAYLRDVDSATRSDFVDALYGEYPAGYDSTDGWWRCVKRGLGQVPLVDGGEGSRRWEFASNRPTLSGLTVTRVPGDE